MPSIIPLAANPSQEVRVTLDGQVCRVRIYTRQADLPILAIDATPSEPPTYANTEVLYLDLYVSDVLIVGGVRCYVNVRLIRDDYLGFVGDLSFYDLYGTDDPSYTGLGTRWLLLYWTPDELPDMFDVETIIYYLDDNDVIIDDDNYVPIYEQRM